MPDKHPLTRRDLYTLLLILFIAALLRFGEAGVVEFFHDDAMLATLAQELAAGEHLPLTGILSSTGIPNPPVSVYIMALPFLLTSDPQVAVLFVMALNVAGVGLLWLLARLHFGRPVALAAGLAYALNPWAVLFSRKIWAQDFHTPFILAALLLGLYGFWSRGERRARHEWAQALCLPLLLLGLQIHFAAWALLPLYGLLLWGGCGRLSRRALAASALLAVLVLLPYAAGLASTLQGDPTRISDAAARSQAAQGLGLTPDALVYTAYLAAGAGLETWVAPDRQAHLLEHVPPLTPLWSLIGLAALVGPVALWQSGQRRFVPLLLVWALLPPLLLVPDWTPVYVHYFIAGLPALALLSGIGLEGMVKVLRGGPQGRVVALSLFAVILLTQGLWWRALLRYLDTTDIPYPGFTTPLHYLNNVRDDLRDDEDVVVVSYGMSWLLHHESAVWPVMLRDSARCVRTLPAAGYAVLPQGPFAVLVTPDAVPGGVDEFYQTAEVSSHPVRPGGGFYYIYRHDSAPQWTQSTLTPLMEPALFEMGVQLTSYSLDEEGITLEWLLPERRPGLDYQYGVHFLDETGERLGQHDAQFWPGRHWCSGDRLLTTTVTSPPPQTHALRVSLYRLLRDGGFASADVLDVMGNPAGQWVEITLPGP